MTVGQLHPTVVAGLQAQTFDVALRFRDPRTACETLLLVCNAIAPGRYLTPGTQMRRIVVRSDPDPVIIDLIGATRRDLDKLETPAARVIVTLRIRRR
jgi:hypothetical protein